MLTGEEQFKKQANERIGEIKDVHCPLVAGVSIETLSS